MHPAAARNTKRCRSRAPPPPANLACLVVNPDPSLVPPRGVCLSPPAAPNGKSSARRARLGFPLSGESVQSSAETARFGCTFGHPGLIGAELGSGQGQGQGSIRAELGSAQGQGRQGTTIRTGQGQPRGAQGRGRGGLEGPPYPRRGRGVGGAALAPRTIRRVEKALGAAPRAIRVTRALSPSSGRSSVSRAVMLRSPLRGRRQRWRDRGNRASRPSVGQSFLGSRYSC